MVVNVLTMLVDTTDPYADNYDPDATEDDGTCLYNGCAAGTIARLF